MSARDWHQQAIEPLADRQDEPVAAARRAYHAAWLAHLERPDDPACRPVVSVLIPVYNRAGVVVEAIESCLEQTYPAIEIIVIDDGSTDRIADALAPYRTRITLVTQRNAGVSAARNAGARAARGAFLHFLDSDNLLAPECISRKIDAFREIADAELCFSGFDELDADGVPCAVTHTYRPDGGWRCPTTELMRAVAPRYPFIVSSVMLPRWLYLAVGGFEEDLRRYHEDTRLWFTLALRGTKTIALDEALAIKRHRHDSLSHRWRTGSRDATHELVVLRCAADVIGTPTRWEYVLDYLEPALARPVFASLDPGVRDEHRRLRAAIRACVLERGRSGASALPILMACLLRVRAAAIVLDTAGATARRTRRALEAELRTAIQAADGLAARDLTRWRNAQAGAQRPNPVVRLLLTTAGTDLSQAEHSLTGFEAAVRSAGHQRFTAHWYAFAGLARQLGSARAVALARRIGPLGCIGSTRAVWQFVWPRLRRHLGARSRAWLGHVAAAKPAEVPRGHRPAQR
ncbi:MAG: glycosyltransferase family A protein [Burkholderiaceae bacterium]